MAQQLVEQLAVWLPPAGAGGAADLSLCRPDALPYERITWSSATRQRRLTAMAALQRPQSGHAPLVVASARALMQKTLPARELRLALRSVKAGSAVRLEQMALSWVQTGYNPADVVEEPGTFARRGGIVDIWPPNLPTPVRIDLFGEEVESLRLFDPATQRTVRQVESVEIGPGSEVLEQIWPRDPGTAARAWRRADGAAESAVSSRASAEHLAAAGPAPAAGPARGRCGWRSSISHAGHSFHGIEWYMPYATASRPADRPPGRRGARWWWTTRSISLPPWHELELQAEALRSNWSAAGELPRSFSAHFFTADELRARLVERRPALLGYGDLYGKSAGANTPLARALCARPRYGGKTKEIAARGRQGAPRGHYAVSGHAPGGAAAGTAEEVHLVPQRSRPDRRSRRRPASVNLVHGVLGEGFILRGLESSTAAPAPRSALHFSPTPSSLAGASRRPARGSKAHSTVAPEIFFADMKPGEYVVHIEHGIGMFRRAGAHGAGAASSGNTCR